MGVVEFHYMCWPVCMRVILTVPSPVNPLCLQSLFRVTDVFLPPDYVANLQKVSHTDMCSGPCPVYANTPAITFSSPSHQSMHHTPVSHAFDSPQRQSASRPPRTPSSGASNGTPGGQGKRAGKSPKSAKVEQDQPLPSSQDESPLNRYVNPWGKSSLM